MFHKSTLKEILLRADNAYARGIRGPFRMERGQLTGFVIVAGTNDLVRELFATGYTGAGNTALHCASSADPETMRELVRGYIIAMEAGLLNPASGS